MLERRSSSCAGESTRTRAAASSSASGSCSSRAQSSATPSVEANDGSAACARERKSSTPSSGRSSVTRIGLLAGQAQQLAARHEQRAGCGQAVSSAGDVVGGVGQVLEVVEHEQERAVGDVLGDVLLGAERLRDGRQDELRVVERRERHPEDAVREAVGRGARRLQREACLADAARAGQRQQARLARAQQRRRAASSSSVAAEERRRGDGQVGAVEALAAAGTRRSPNW